MLDETESKQYLERQRKGRWVFLSMLIFFIAPIIAVIAMYELDWRPQGRSVGELITPAMLIQMPDNPPSSSKLLSEGEKVTPDFWQNKWSMVYVADGDCDAKCKAKLHYMRQIHVSLYKEIPRMQRVLITTQLDVTELKKMYPDLHIINGDSEALYHLHEQFSEVDQPASQANQLGLVDPRGFYMMRYATETDPALIRKDIVRLMKYSWAG